MVRILQRAHAKLISKDNMKEISVRECLSFGWYRFKSRPWLFVGTGLILLGASILADLPRSIIQHAAPGKWAFGFIAFVISTGISFLVSMGKTAFYLRAHDSTETADFKDLWHPHPYWKYGVVSILAGAATIIGLILLIVPGIIIGIMLGFSLYIVIEKESKPIDAMRESIALTKGHRWNLFLLGLALLGINILGLLALVVGLFVSLPVSMLAIVHAYRILSGTGKAAIPVV